jgi:hypothetical protein
MMCGCGTEVLEVGDPAFLIEARPHPLGVWKPDGDRLTIREAADGVPGHHRHLPDARLCAAGQYALFGTG